MQNAVSKRYAKALLEVGIAHNKLDKLQSDIAELAGLYDGSRDLRAIIANPSVGATERRKVLESLATRAGWDGFTKNFALILVDNERFDAISGIRDSLQALVDVHKGDVRATVTSATPLKDSQVANVKGAIAKITGKNVLLETEVDPSILGGLVTHIGSTVYDGSVATQIQSLKESILREV